MPVPLGSDNKTTRCQAFYTIEPAQYAAARTTKPPSYLLDVVIDYRDLATAGGPTSDFDP